MIADNIDFGSSSDLGTQGELLAHLMSEGLAHGGSLNADGGWDTHDNLGDQHGLHNDLFIGLKRLADALESYGLLNDTMVVVVSEMSRTPVMNSDNGKDHWSYTSALVFGEIWKVEEFWAGRMKHCLVKGSTLKMVPSIPGLQNFSTINLLRGFCT